MVRHKLVKERVNKLAKELGVFTTRQMVDRFNSYTNNTGRRTGKSPSINANKCHNFLRMDPEIIVKERYLKNNGDTRNIWEWIGEEE